MQIKNYATVSVDTTAGGTVVITDAQMQAARNALGGVQCLLINPSVDCVVVDGTADGTVANSPATILANTPNVVMHTSGPLRLLSTSGTATVKIAAVGGP